MTATLTLTICRWQIATLRINIDLGEQAAVGPGAVIVAPGPVPVIKTSKRLTERGIKRISKAWVARMVAE